MDFVAGDLRNLLSQETRDYKKIFPLIEEEIKKILPFSWEIILKIKRKSIHKPSNELNFHDYEWKIIPDDPNKTKHSILKRFYLLEISFDCDCFIFYHDNGDAGGIYIEKTIEESHIIPFNSLDFFPLSEIINHLIKVTKPNTYGLS
jgi:hypothetical protein